MQATTDWPTTGSREQEGAASQRGSMPFAIYMFALTAFALGLAEFVPIGLSDIMAGSLKVSNESVGALVSAYALGATISAPIFSALTAAWARKRVMLATALVFSLGSFVAASSSDLAVMVAARFVAGLGHGLFLAVATSVAAQLVGGKRAGTAVALVFGGFTIALAIGVPISTWAGSFVSWRPLFFVITGFGILGLVGLMVSMKADAVPANDNAMGAALRGLKALVHPRLLAGVAVTVLAYVGSFGAFTYIAPLLIERAGANMSTVSAFMLVYGVMAAIGNVIGGKITDSMGANRSSVVIVVGITVTVLGMYLLSSSVIAMAVLTAVLGLLTFGAVPPLQARLLSLAELHTPESVGVAAGLNIAGFNSGIVVGSAIGGVTMGVLGVAYTPLVAAVTAGLGAVILIAQIRK